MDQDFLKSGYKLFAHIRMNRLGIPQDRIAKRLGLGQQRISRYLLQMPQVAKSVNSDLLKGFTVSQVAEKHGWTEPQVWSQALVNKDDFSRFKELNWGLQETHIFQAPLSSERFQANVVSAMQKKKIVGVTSRYVIISKKKPNQD
ncbi:MAG: hypothetical protein JRC93_08975 [Deltaproteobacteria bacterium]|nr:hypothetical protein [Deltaproteobacteria bacterium]